MKKIFLFTILLFCFAMNGQIDRIMFDYDQAGNQIKRYWCSGCNARQSNNQSPKELEELEAVDMQKFHPEDEFMYFPNPVKEELFLKWPLQEGKKLKNISVYNLSGQLVKQYTNLEMQESQNIPFSSYPVSTYILVLKYTNGEQKSINIFKKQ